LRILVACEYSGIVREAFRAKGHDAWSCDILPSDQPSLFHYQGNVLDIINDGFDMMIAHPPCTYLSNVGAVHLYKDGVLNQDRYSYGLIAKDFFMSLLNTSIGKICIENPVASKVYQLPAYSQIIQPYHYGEPFAKKTCLWLKGLPQLQPTKILKEYQSTTALRSWYNKGGKNRQKNRAKTFPGIAKAMAEQWG